MKEIEDSENDLVRYIGLFSYGTSFGTFIGPVVALRM